MDLQHDEQASHWKKGKDLGLIDPRAADGRDYDLQALDLTAFDSIGYNRSSLAAVPEPTGVLAGLLLLVPAIRRRRLA